MVNIFDRLFGAGSRQVRSTDLAEPPLSIDVAEERSTVSAPISASDPLVARLFGCSDSLHLALNLATASRCISILTGTFASAEAVLYRHAPDGGSPTPAIGHPLYDILLNGTDTLSAYELKAALMESLVTHGESFARVSFDSAGRLTNIEPLEYHLVTVEILGNGRIRYLVADDLRNFTQTAYAESQIAHLKWRPKNHRGRSPLQLAALSVGLAASLEQSVSDEAKSGFKAGGILTAPGSIGDDAAKRLKQTFEDGYMGREAAGRVAVLGDGLSFQRMGLSSQEAELLESRRFSAYMVAAAYGVPGDVAGLPFESSWNSAAEASRQFVNMSAAVWSSCLLEQLAAFVLGARERRSLYIASDFRNLIAGSLQERATAYNSLVSGGIMSPDEARKAFDLPPLPGGSTLRLPLNTAPATTPEAVGAEA